MGNRILKESIRISRQIEALSYFEEVVFYRLITAADDYGVYSADPVMLARTLFPLRESVDRTMMAEALGHMEAVGLVCRYSVEDKGEWLQIVSWAKHQRLRNSRRVYPAPEDGTEGAPGDCPAETDEPETEEGEPEAEVREIPVAELPLKDGTDYAVTREEADEYAAAYPAVDVYQQLREMQAWCRANPQKQKTRSGIRAFIVRWLAGEQDKGGGTGPLRPAFDNPFARMAKEAEQEEAAGNSSGSGWHWGGEAQ